MAQWNSAIEVTFNDNDGGAGWRINPIQAYDIHRHWKIFGKWRTRWILFKRFWRGMKEMERYTDMHYAKTKRLWVFRAEIPE